MICKNAKQPIFLPDFCQVDDYHISLIFKQISYKRLKNGNKNFFGQLKTPVESF